MVESCGRTRGGRGLAAAALPLCLLALAAPLTAAETAPAANAAAVAAPAAPSGEPRLARERLPAAGRQATTLAVPEFGRYSVRVESRQGVALSIVDRMSGPGPVAGEAGKQDGRVDLFLDRGEVRVVTVGPQLGRGEARLAVAGFRELSTAPRSLPELRTVTEELGDFEQTSYWLEIRARRRVAIEAAGRHLADLRLWQNGTWLIDEAPQVSTIEPLPGRPLRLCQLTADLEPGLYRLTAYGGKSLPWSHAARERPLYLRSGIPWRGEAGREWMTIGPFGFERVLVPGSATYFRVELPEARPVHVALDGWDRDKPFAELSNSYEITKETNPPFVEEHFDASQVPTEVVVRGTPGQPFVLQHFLAARRVPLPVDGAYWVGSVHAGFAPDSIDATGLVFEQTAERPVRAMAEQALVLSSTHGWARRFNLLAPASVFVRVEEAGTYELVARGVAASVRLEPLLLDRPAGYEAPPPRTAPTSWDLDPGLYVLTLTPTEAGIAAVAFRHRGLLDPLLDWVGLGKAPPPTAAAGALAFPALDLARHAAYVLLLSDQPGIEAGPVVRALPLDLTQPLPLALAPGAEIATRMRAGGRGWLAATAEDGSVLDVAVDRGPWGSQFLVEPGEHQVRVRSSRPDTVSATLALVPEEQVATTPLAPIDPARLAALPSFPTLTAAAPLALDLETGAAASFVVVAAEPALYTLETTGLLATGGAIRTRVVPSLAHAEQNGSGRNVSLRPYLREGDYQLTVRALGESAGHLGVRLARAAVRDGGRLAEGLPARAALAEGEAVAYRFRVEREGRYRVRALRLGGAFDVRLEDTEGFPVAAPVLPGQTEIDLLPGDYRLIVLPQTVAARAVTAIERLETPSELAGHGPHPLALATAVTHLWLEPAGPSRAASATAADAAGAPREADRWRFTLPAATSVTITLDQEMEADLLRLGGAATTGGAAEEKVGYVAPGRGFAGELAAGDFELAVRCSRRNNQVRYQLAVRPADLVDGLTRELQVPAEVAVAVGREGQVELASFGDADVRARLYAADGSLLAAADDRPGDWNFLVARRLAPGRYRLRVDPVGSASAATRIAMRVPVEQEEAAWTLPGAHRLEVRDEVRVVPLALPAGAELLAVGAAAPESLGFELERRAPGEGEGWTALASAEGTAPRLLLPLASDGRAATAAGGAGAASAANGASYRLRLWSLDRRPTSVDLAGFAGSAPHASERALAGGVALAPLRGMNPPVAVLAVDLDRPGCFRREGGEEELLAARRSGEPFRGEGGVLVAGERRLWLAALPDGGRSGAESATTADSARAPRVTARRAMVGAPALTVRLAAGETAACDLGATRGPVFATGTALASEPLVAVLRPASLAASPDRIAALGRHRGATLAAGEPGSMLAVTNAGREPVEVRLRATPLTLAAPAGETAVLSTGGFDTRLAAGSARLLRLPVGAKRLRVVLAAGGAAEVGGLAASESLVWAAEAARDEDLVTSATELLLANPLAEEIAARVEIVPALAEDAIAPLAAGGRFERWFERAGALRLRVAPGPSGPTAAVPTLHVRGAEALLLGADGAIGRGADLAPSRAGGVLVLDHGPGLVAAWLDAADRRPEAYGFELPATAEVLALPAALALDGASRLVEVEAAESAFLSLRSATPMAVALLDVQGQVARFEISPEHTSFDAPLAAGRTRLALRALAGRPLVGEVELVAQPTPELGEGLGPATLLAAGATRAYRFRVPRDGPVGVGVRAEGGGVETRVFDAAGQALGRGVVQWLKLTPGTYTLALAAPTDGSPVLAQAAVVGIAPPGDGPPPEVMKTFLELERGGPPVGGSGIVGAPDEPKPFLKSWSSEPVRRGGDGMREAPDDESMGDGEYGDEGDEDDGSGDQGGWR